MPFLKTKVAPPILALTAHTRRQDHDRFLSGGMTACIVKPFTSTCLLEAVEHWGRHQEQAAQTVCTPVRMTELENSMRAAGIEDALETILDLFREDSPRRMETLMAAVQEEDMQAISAAAHVFKSSAGGIMATELEKLLDRIEQAALSDHFGTIATLLQSASEEWKQVVNYLAGLEPAAGD